MTDRPVAPLGVHLVGSIPLPDSESVFRTMAAELGERLHTIPDGEPAGRSGWVQCLFDAFNSTPGLVPDPDTPPHPNWPTAFKIDPAARTAEIEFPELGYAQWARESFELFDRLQSEGVVPQHCRFQISLPTPTPTLVCFAAADAMAALEAPMERALSREVKEISKLPADRIAVQFDICDEVVFGEMRRRPGLEMAEHEAWSTVKGTPDDFWTGDPVGTSISRIVRLASQLPTNVPVGFHLCYGDLGVESAIEILDTGFMVEFANGLHDALGRPIEWIHMPGAVDRADGAFFAPLRSLRLPAETRLYLGLVSFNDGLEGAARRLAAAMEVRPQVGLAYKCGMGRRPSEQLPDLLRIHRELSAPIHGDA